MADTISIQELIDARTDAKTLEEAVNGDAVTTVLSRLGETYPTLSNALNQIDSKLDSADTQIKQGITDLFQNGGLPATPFVTKALMTASALVNGDYAMVTDDTVNNGFYVKTAGAWVKSSYDPYKSIVEYIDSSNTISKKYNSDLFSINDKFIVFSTGSESALTGYKATPFIESYENIKYEYSIATTQGGGGAFYDKDKKFISGFGGSSSAGSVNSIISPAQTMYVRFSNQNSNTNAYVKSFGMINREKVNSIISQYPTSSLLKQQHGPEIYTIPNSYVDYSTGKFGGSSAYTRTDYIKIEPAIYTIVSQNGNNAGIVWYDKNKSFISGFPLNTGVATNVTAPSNASYIVLSAYNQYVSSTYIKKVGEGFNIDSLMNVVNAHVKSGDKDLIDTVLKEKLTDPMLGIKVVDDKNQMLQVSNYGALIDEKAYPVGRRIYVKSLRSEVVADGMFWRKPDGTAAALADEVYTFPDWDEIRKALPSYAKNYRKIYDVQTTGLNGWVSTVVGALSNVSLSSEYGDNRILLTHTAGSPLSYYYLANSAALGLYSYIIFDYHINMPTASDSKIGLFALDGTLLFSLPLTSAVMGGDKVARPFYTNDHVKAEVFVKDMLPAFEGALLANVKHIGFMPIAKSSIGGTSKMYLGNIETVSFKPKITLRFDDQKSTVYDTAYPIMQAYGFKGLIAVVTGAPNLGAEPDFSEAWNGMTKQQLLEVRSLGWDLVSHTHTHTKDVRTDDYMRQDYRKSRDYLRKELNAGMIGSSTIITPNGNRYEREAKIQREFFDAGVDGVFSNSQMPRQPTGQWRAGSTWASMGTMVGDNRTTLAPLRIAIESVIDREQWAFIMIHNILPSTTNAVTLSTEVFTELCAWLNTNRDLVDVVTIESVVTSIRPAV